MADGDVSAFIVDRVMRCLHLEAVRLLGEGVAGVDEIDGFMRSLARFKLGPFESMDQIGLDVDLKLTEALWNRTDQAVRFEPHEIQRMLVDRGHVGCKSSQGFYKYDGQVRFPAYPVDRRSFDLSPLLGDAILAFSTRAGLRKASTTERYVFSRILSVVINEAGLIYSEKVAGSGDIDLILLSDAGFPKGSFAWADEIGPRTVRGLLTGLNNAASDDRFTPAPVFRNAD